MRVAIGIPSFQEAQTIAAVTTQVDAGLAQLPSHIDRLIINADGGSPDGTPDTFLDTRTKCQKVSLVTHDHLGKGSNVLALARYCLDHQVDALALIDADVRTVTPEWPLILTSSLLDGQADYVAPLYKRRRLEGATTNHLAYPFLNAYLGGQLRQPIGGEFGLSRKFIDYILKQPIDDEICGYGIDIFMSMHAVGGGFSVVQADLGSKLHNPSFAKGHRIFPEVTATAFGVARLYSPSENVDTARPPAGAIDESREDLNEHDARETLDWALQQMRELLPVYAEWLGHDTEGIARELTADEPQLSAEVWTELAAAGAAQAVLAPASDAKRGIADKLFPAWRVRAISFSRRHRESSTEIVEAEIEEQRQLFRHHLRDRLSRASGT